MKFSIDIDWLTFAFGVSVSTDFDGKPYGFTLFAGPFAFTAWWNQ